MRNRILCFAFLLVACSTPTQGQSPPPSAKAAENQAADDPALPRVLIIGDSISIGYTAPVRQLLQGKANVHRIPANGGPTTRGLENIEAWLGDGKWDVIHFNFGLHDQMYKDAEGNLLPVTTGRPQVSVESYEQNLETLVQRMKRTGAKLLWASTTPVPPMDKHRVAKDAALYNAAALRVMQRHQVAVDDLEAFAIPRLAEIQLPGNVHFTKEGYAVLASEVARSIESVLPAKQTGTPGQRRKPLNVLFIASDDMRPDLGCYGHPHVKTPNFDRLAARGTLFRHAYCQQAVCGASRASLMTGLRPDSVHVYDNGVSFRETRPDVSSLPEHFQQQGYFTEHVGKIFHGDDPKSWSRNVKYPAAPRRGPEGEKVIRELQAAKRSDASTQDRIRGLPWESPEVGDRELADGTTVDSVIRILNEVQDRPFFVACGFANPHLPFVAPKKYWDLYDPATIQLAANPAPPRDAPRYAPTNWAELRAYVGIPAKGPLSEEQARQAIHGYWAAISYVDAQLGRLLDEVDRLGLTENTVIIFWGDHGWQLGEHGCWCKHTNYEVATHVPLMLAVPGQKHAGVPSDRLVEFVDIFPTLCEACALPLPKHLEGSSMMPLLEQPDRPWKSAVFHQYPRTIPGHGPARGHSIRTDRYRMVEWKSLDDGFAEYELYDLRADQDENTNIAGEPTLAQMLGDLKRQLDEGWTAARPELNRP